MNNKIFKRKIYNQILDWKTSQNGSSALLIEGARRVGKSTIVKTFAKNEYKSCIIIDFNVVSSKITSLFDDLTDLNIIFLKLQSFYNVKLYERNSVIVFDEVQKCPNARQAIKYLVEDGRYDYIETGSLISIKKNVQNILIPSEEFKISMYPLDYEEFRWALDDEVSIGLLKEFYLKKIPLEQAHKKAMIDFRLYILVGGMPQAINKYLQTNNLKEVDIVKRQILQLYSDDFQKIDKTGRLSQLFLSIPSQLSKNSNRYKPSDILEKYSQNSLLELIFALQDSKTVNIAFNCNDPNVGMAFTKDLTRYKIYLADTGLFVTLCFWDKDFTENIIYQKLLEDKLEANLGYIYENVVAQILKSSGYQLYYNTFPKDEKHNYEIDFLISKFNKICPIEVKSSGYQSCKSLEVFSDKFSSRIFEKYLIYTKDLKILDNKLICLPVYMAEFL